VHELVEHYFPLLVFLLPMIMIKKLFVNIVVFYKINILIYSTFSQSDLTSFSPSGLHYNKVSIHLSKFPISPYESLVYIVYSKIL